MVIAAQHQFLLELINLLVAREREKFLVKNAKDHAMKALRLSLFFPIFSPLFSFSQFVPLVKSPWTRKCNLLAGKS